MQRSRFWFDTEFIEDGRTIELLSIGIIDEPGNTYYAVNADCDMGRANPFVCRNVIPHLGPDSSWKPRYQIVNEVLEFCGDKPEFWAYFADYDWVVMCQLFGRMVDLPENWPKFCLDVQQLYYLSGDPRDLPPMRGRAHNALDDAAWCRDAWRQVWEYMENP